MALVSCLSLLTVPAVNSLTRIGEAQADAYALRTTNLPGALASALLKTAEYRYPRPYPWQELVFYNHPSVEKRVLAAMEWKRSEEHTSELQSLMRISYAVFCLKKKTTHRTVKS